MLSGSPKKRGGGVNARLRAVLYARVSTDEQARTGYSLRQQLKALRDYCTAQRIEIVGEFADDGVSGAILERPGLGALRDRVAEGGVDLVLAQDVDRVSREPWHYEYLRFWFEDHGATLRTLDDPADDSPMGEFVSYIRRGVAKLEKEGITRRMERGRRQRVWEGKIIATSTPPFGFEFNADRSNLIVDLSRMRVVERIFRMAGPEDASLRAIKKALEDDGVPAPMGGEHWTQSFIRKVIFSDLYRAHTFSELEGLVSEGVISPDVFSKLDPGARHGLWWYGTQSVKRRNGTRKVTPRPRSEWIGVPTPDPHVPREWVDLARERVAGNVRPSRAAGRFWELSGGILYCDVCGRRMRAFTVSPRHGHHYRYYICDGARTRGVCSNRKYHNAEHLEKRVRRFVLDLIRNPEELREQVEAQGEEMKRKLRAPDAEIRALLKLITHADTERDGYNRLYARGKIDDGEYDAYIGELNQRKAGAEARLAELKDTKQRIAELEDLPELVDGFLRDLPHLLTWPIYKPTPEGPLRLEPVTSETVSPPRERDEEAEAAQWRGVYEDLGLRAATDEDGMLEVTWRFGQTRLSLDEVPQESSFVNGETLGVTGGMPLP
jgi:site-specific DNA recombinase